MTKQADLVAYLFDGKPHPLSGALGQWMEASPRYTAFVETYRDKIRKKIRITLQPESILDLGSELEVPYHLLDDRRLEVVYEPYASERRRGADFAVTFRVNTVFNLEAARLRSDEGQAGGRVPPRLEARLLRILLDKLGQMQPGMANLLVIQARPELARSIDLTSLMQALKNRVEGKDPAFYSASRYSGPAAFYKDFLHLSGIVLWSAGAMELPSQVWTNKQARPVLDEKIIFLVGGLLSGAG